MIYLMNSAVMPAGDFGTYEYAPATLGDLADVLRGVHGEYKSCIGYPQNCELIKQWTGVKPELSRRETQFVPGDMAFVMRMKRRIENPGSKGAAVSEDPKSWEFAWVTFLG